MADSWLPRTFYGSRARPQVGPSGLESTFEKYDVNRDGKLDEMEVAACLSATTFARPGGYLQRRN